MKTLQRQSAWTLQSMLDGTGRRRLTIDRSFPQPVSRRRVALRHNGIMKLAVTFASEESSGFEAVIRRGA